MKEIKLFYDKAEEKEVGDIIVFEPVEAGEIATKTIYIKNTIKFRLKLDVVLTGDIDKKEKIEIEPFKMESLTFNITPEKNKFKPITANLTIKLEYLIK